MGACGNEQSAVSRGKARVACGGTATFAGAGGKRTDGAVTAKARTSSCAPSLTSNTAEHRTPKARAAADGLSEIVCENVDVAQARTGTS